METSISIVSGLIELLKTGGLFGLIAFITYVVCQLLKILIIALFAYFGIKHISNSISKMMGNKK